MSEVSLNIKDVFLCHNKTDKDWVRALGGRLEAETIDGLPSSRRLSVFFDEWDIDPGENAINRMNAGLSASRFVAVVMSPEFFKSGWTNFEWTDVVAEDPWGAKRKLIPILLRDISSDGSERITFPAPFKALNYLDFREKSRFEIEFQRLLRRVRGLPPQRGAEQVSKYSAGSIPVVANEESDSWQPDRLRDVLLSNLLEVQSFPPIVWSAKTEKQSPGDVRKVVPDAEGHIIRAGRLWTFADLSSKDCHLREVINTASVNKESSREWMLDSEKLNWWVALLNQALTSHLSKLAIKKDEKGRFFFRPNKDGSTRVWESGRDRPREVASQKTNLATGNPFWVHHAARIHFRLLGDRFFLMIEPTYLFTSDGEHALGGQQMGRMAMMWGGRQKNPDILRSLVFWTKVIAKNSKQVAIKTGGDPIVLKGIPALASANVGIEMDHVRIGSLMRTVDDELDQVAQDVEIVEPEEAGEEEGNEENEE